GDPPPRRHPRPHRAAPRPGADHPRQRSGEAVGPVSLTHRRTLGPGDVLSRGTQAPYRAVAPGPGEEHVIRTELLGEPGAPPGGGGRAAAAGERRALACVA